TGDIKENLDAPIVVATLESYRNSLLGTEPDLGRSLVIFDEYHYLQDEGRGSAWEEALILTPPSCQVLLLSASVANSAEFADWVSSLTKRRCTLVQTLHRPVPLTNLVYYGNHWLTEDNIPEESFKNLSPNLKERSLKLEDLVTRLPKLIDLNLTPCILYSGKRLDCENLAILIEKSLPPLPQEHAERIGAVLMAAHQEVGSLSFIKPSLRRMIQTYGVAYHHSGLAPAARIAIERLVKDGQLRFCVATMGLSLGINFSVRSALISDYQRPGESGMTNYAEGEVLQMLGRAGRRGKDVIGFSLWPNAEAYSRMSQSKREACNSRLRTDPSTILGLLGRGLTLGMLEGIYAKSFMKFQNRKIDLRLIRKPDVENKLGSASLPCISPAAEFARYENRIAEQQLLKIRQKSDPKLTSAASEHLSSDSLCPACQHQPICHSYIAPRKVSRLAAMHIHLHRVGCITKDETLTPLGSIGRYFPQSGGLLISRMIVDGRVKPDKLLHAAELMAALCLPRFKEPGSDPFYKFPFDTSKLEHELEELYPKELFMEAYDEPYGRRTWYQIKEWNPGAGWIIRQWLTGAMDWPNLVKNGTTEYFGVGDLMGLMYRIGTYLQSMAGMGIPEYRQIAPALRRELLKSPLDLTL
ncbi:MAG: helicase-related protein, partial [Proteobacteria bacterium]|nr:helicase-related protein [Pseudomonadota bacterium]